MTSRLRCPRCGRNDAIQAQAKLWVQAIADPDWGLRSEIPEHPEPWMEDRSRAECSACGQRGRLKRFLAADEELSPDEQRAASKADGDKLQALIDS